MITFEKASRARTYLILDEEALTDGKINIIAYFTVSTKVLNLREGIINQGQTPFLTKTRNEKSKAKNCEGLLIHKKKKRSLFPAPPTRTPHAKIL